MHHLFLDSFIQGLFIHIHAGFFHPFIHSCMHAAFIHACIHSCIHWIMLVHLYTYIHTFMHAGLIYSLIHSFIHPGFIHSYSCMQAWFIQSYIYACMHTASFIYSFIHAGDSFIHESIDSKSLTFIHAWFIHSFIPLEILFLFLLVSLFV